MGYFMVMSMALIVTRGGIIGAKLDPNTKGSKVVSVLVLVQTIFAGFQVLGFFNWY